jgi:hypothetical protein
MMRSGSRCRSRSRRMRMVDRRMIMRRDLQVLLLLLLLVLPVLMLEKMLMLMLVMDGTIFEVLMGVPRLMRMKDERGKIPIEVRERGGGVSTTGGDLFAEELVGQPTNPPTKNLFCQQQAAVTRARRVSERKMGLPFPVSGPSDTSIVQRAPAQ